MKLIAGIDPGMITAVAAIDIESDFYKTYSSRNFTFSEICDYLVTVGEPIIISVDTMHAPETVRRVAAAFSARLYYPKRDLYIGEKKTIIGEKDVKNDHERDALAAAMYAKSFFSSLFKKVDNALGGKSLGYLSPDVKELLVKHESGNIEQAVKMLLGEARPQIKVVPRLIETKKVLELRREMESLEKENIRMKKRIDILEVENKKLKQPVRTNETDSIRNLRKSLTSLMNEKRSLEKEYALYKELEKDYEILSDGPEKNGIIIFKDGMDVSKLEKLEPHAIISEKILDTSIPVIHPERINIERVGSFTVVKKGDIETALGNEGFIEWLSKYKEMRKNELQKT